MSERERIALIEKTYKDLDEKYPDQICNCQQPDCGECSVKFLLAALRNAGVLP